MKIQTQSAQKETQQEISPAGLPLRRLVWHLQHGLGQEAFPSRSREHFLNVSIELKRAFLSIF